MVFRLKYFEVGDQTQFNKALQDQLTADMTETRLEYLAAVKKETLVKAKYHRRRDIRSLPEAQLTADDRKLKRKAGFLDKNL